MMKTAIATIASAVRAGPVAAAVWIVRRAPINRGDCATSQRGTTGAPIAAFTSKATNRISPCSNLTAYLDQQQADPRRSVADKDVHYYAAW